MADQVRLGIIGIRNIGLNHGRKIMACPHAELVAVADTSAELRAEACTEFKIDRSYASAEELLAQPDIDGVILALPNPLHASLSIQSLKAGKHVLVEKPMARFCDEAKAMIKARNESGKLLMIGMNQRFEPEMAAAREAIVSGVIGEIQQVRARWTRCRTPKLWSRGDWALRHESSGGGPLLDLGIHKLDQALYVMGFPRVTSVSGFASYGLGEALGQSVGKDYQVEDAGGGLARLENGGTLYLEASYFQNCVDVPEQSLEIFGTKGGLIRITGEPVKLYTLDESGERVDLPMVDAPGVSSSPVEHFSRVVLGQESLIPTAEEALHGLAVVEGMYLSSQQNCEIKISEIESALAV